MKRPRRWLLNASTAISLLLCAITVLLWLKTLHGDASLSYFTDWHTRFQIPSTTLYYGQGPRAVSITHLEGEAVQISAARGTFEFRLDYYDPSVPSQFSRPTKTNQQVDWSYIHYPPARSDPPLNWLSFETHRASNAQLVGNTPYVLNLAYFYDMPLWILSAAFAIAPAFFLYRHLHHRAQSSKGLCPTCGYDLRATPNQCPECGRIPTNAAPSH